MNPNLWCRLSPLVSWLVRKKTRRSKWDMNLILLRKRCLYVVLTCTRRNLWLSGSVKWLKRVLPRRVGTLMRLSVPVATYWFLRTLWCTRRVLLLLHMSKTCALVRLISRECDGLILLAWRTMKLARNLEKVSYLSALARCRAWLPLCPFSDRKLIVRARERNWLSSLVLT